MHGEGEFIWEDGRRYIGSNSNDMKDLAGSNGLTVACIKDSLRLERCTVEEGLKTNLEDWWWELGRMVTMLSI